MNANQQLIGGALVLLPEDFCQKVPVISRSTSTDEINACLKSSILWRYICMSDIGVSSPLRELICTS